MLQALIANVNRDRKTRPYQADTFVPKWGRASTRKGPATGEEMLAAVKKINKAMGGGTNGDSRRPDDRDRDRS
jgi:hypothetical protein